MSEEKLPISEALKVVEGVTLYKTSKWWSAAALVESFGRNQIGVYLWNNREGKWKRKQKFVIHSKEEWNKMKDVIENLVAKLR